ncbi:hypothetical protein [Candidatus Neptunochlamydia vexilliferae]|uniref:Secreted protein n=1 Tax=Candidatus Neptunichlamydia vexilliferae TaxID=1651774 RepID=A0ABS0AXB4_9BACT|nr:hypothetical protein [Candidatus Neptunochlamydia vexilliferae]MBF5058766.1 hypothetical protein [Candidatus Neptunochlamydia vexilliferae]
MKKWIFIFLVFGVAAFADEKEDRAKDLYGFTEAVFGMLREESQIIDQSKREAFAKRLHVYEKDVNPEISALAEKFISSFESGEQEDLGEAVSSLGRLLKCSVDDKYYRYNTSYVLHKGGIQKELAFMESALGDRCPHDKGLNYHKVMIESLAERQYDLALYSYLKIAEARCVK